jgi:hypothetical protein
MEWSDQMQQREVSALFAIFSRAAVMAALALAVCSSADAANLSGALGSSDAIVIGAVSSYTDNVTSISFTTNRRDRDAEQY